MRRLHEGGYDVADNLLVAFAGCGYLLTPETRILDLGCGAGGLVYRFRDLGYEAYGFDIHDRVEYRDPLDRKFFGFIENPSSDTSNTVFDTRLFRIPFDDNSFDVVLSTSVLEHVMNLDLLMLETARVLRHGGFAYHLYPNTSVFVEPHVYIPFASRNHARWYLYLWALLGVRNEFQRDLTPSQAAEANVRFFREGLRYYSRAELAAVASRHFGVVRFVDDLYYPGIKDSVFRWNIWEAALAPGTLSERLKAMSQSLKMGSLLTEDKRVVR